MTKIDFEDVVMQALEDWVDEGLPLMRTQSWASRRGGHRMSQGINIVVDSPVEKYYCALELKSRDVTTENGPGLYFSTDYKPRHIQKQKKFGEQSERTVCVAAELQKFRDEYPCYLLPLDLFLQVHQLGRKKVTWEQIAFFGAYMGDSVEGTVSIDDDHFQVCSDVGEWLREDIEQALDEAEEFEDCDRMWKALTPRSWNAESTV